MQFTQTGTVLDVNAKCYVSSPITLDGPLVFGSGTIDQFTGIFSLSFTDEFCAPLTLNGTASADGSELNGTWFCPSQSFGSSFTGAPKAGSRGAVAVDADAATQHDQFIARNLTLLDDPAPSHMEPTVAGGHGDTAGGRTQNDQRGTQSRPSARAPEASVGRGLHGFLSQSVPPLVVEYQSGKCVVQANGEEQQRDLDHPASTRREERDAPHQLGRGLDEDEALADEVTRRGKH